MVRVATQERMHSRERESLERREREQGGRGGVVCDDDEIDPDRARILGT